VTPAPYRWIVLALGSLSTAALAASRMRFAVVADQGRTARLQQAIRPVSMKDSTLLGTSLDVTGDPYR
jgi:hypothetical protein